MAIDMLRVMKQFRTQDDKPVNVRIGINSGPVCAAR
jgi:class 3 adenylate cyclase